jgi:hypothetical protein
MKKHFWLLLGFSFWWVGCVPLTPSTIDSTHQPAEEPQSVLEETTVPSPIAMLTSSPEEVIDPEFTVTPAPSSTKSDLTTTLEPTRSPLPLPTSLPFSITWTPFFYYELFWSVPSTWYPVKEALSESITDGNLIYAASDRSDGLTWLSEPISEQEDGVMLMTLRSMSEMPDVTELQAVEVSGQPGWLLQEDSPSEEASFTRQWVLFVQTLSNRYALSLKCVAPSVASTNDQANYEGLCQQIWERMTAEFSIKDFSLRSEGCPVVPLTPVANEWRRIQSRWTQYSFEVPASWLEQLELTPDRVQFLGEPAAYDQRPECPLPNGLMALNLAADRPGNFGTGQLGSGPDTEGFTEMTVASRPAWLQTVEDEELMGQFATGTTVYIQGPEFWYTVGFSCIPPTNADAEGQAQFKAQCEETLAQFLNSFQILEN